MGLAFTHDTSRESAEGPSRDSRTSVRLPKLEVLATAVLGAAAAAFADIQLGVVTWSVGILLAINQMRVQQRLDEALVGVGKLADYIDLSDRCDVEALRQLNETYMKIPEPEFAALKELTVATAREELYRLGSEKSSGELATGAYYRWLLSMLESTAKGQQIQALSLMMGCEWDDSPAEKRFIESNVAAAERGVQIDRIFVTSIANLATAAANPAVNRHFEEEHPARLRGHFVDIDRLKYADRKLLAKLDDGFLAFDKRVALVDLHSNDGSARGRVTTRPGTLRDLLQTFEELLVHSQPLSRDLLDEPRKSAG